MSWKPRTKCLSCGSDHVQIGSPYPEDDDYEVSTCADCGSSWGGANYWQ